ncbi:MAG: L-threonylcarbamoyladenylate synthase, partial [Thermoplasmata archaeon]
DRAAVGRLEAAKGRPSGQPISVAVSSVPEVEALAELSGPARRFLRGHLPGPYTVLVRPSPLARRTLAPRVFAENGTVGLRVPDHPVARELARRAGPLTATSANFHGAPPCRTVPEARRVFADRVEVYLGSDPPGSGRPSTLVDLTREEPRAVPRK